MIAFPEGWLAFALAFSLAVGVSQTDASVPNVAPAANQIELSPNPSPDYLTSPARARHSFKQQKKGIKKHSKRNALNRSMNRRSSKRSSKSTTITTTTKVYDETLQSIYSGVYPIINIDLISPKGKKQTFSTCIDTSIAETWLAVEDFTCTDGFNSTKTLPQKDCGFGKLYQPDGGFTNITDQVYAISYYSDSNEGLTGDMGYHQMEIAGITIPKAELAFVYEVAGYTADGTTSGFLGLGLPSASNVQYRENGSQVIFDPVFTTMVKDDLVNKPVFSMALNRVAKNAGVKAKAGVIAFGGLVSEKLFKKPFTTTPIVGFQGGEIEFYTIDHEFVFGKTSKSKDLTTTGTIQSFIDPGSSASYMPTHYVKKLNALFDPPAKYNSTLGGAVVDCNAKAPYAAFIINNVTMPIDPRDMIVRMPIDASQNKHVCVTAFVPGGSADTEPMVIGETWMRSYVTSFDMGNTQMHFAPRVPY